MPLFLFHKLLITSMPTWQSHSIYTPPLSLTTKLHTSLAEGASSMPLWFTTSKYQGCQLDPDSYCQTQSPYMSLLSTPLPHSFTIHPHIPSYQSEHSSMPPHLTSVHPVLRIPTRINLYISILHNFTIHPYIPSYQSEHSYLSPQLTSVHPVPRIPTCINSTDISPSLPAPLTPTSTHRPIPLPPYVTSVYPVQRMPTWLNNSPYFCPSQLAIYFSVVNICIGAS